MLTIVPRRWRSGYLHDEETWRFKKWVRPILASATREGWLINLDRLQFAP